MFMFDRFPEVDAMFDYAKLAKAKRESQMTQAGGISAIPAGVSNQAMISMLERQQAQTAARPASSGTPLADAMKAKFEQQFGLPMDDVRVHRKSDEPAKFDAGAYTYGTDIFIGPGQEDTLEHEMTHVAQQKLGQVRPTGMEHGMAVNRSPALEHSADMGTVPQMAGGATGPVVQCSEAGRTQEKIDEELRKMQQAELTAAEPAAAVVVEAAAAEPAAAAAVEAAAAEPATKWSQDDLIALTVRCAKDIFKTESCGDGEGCQEEKDFSIDVGKLKSFLKTMLFKRYREQSNQDLIEKIFEKIGFNRLEMKDTASEEEKLKYNFGTAYYHSDGTETDSHEIVYRVDPGFYMNLPQLTEDYEAYAKSLKNTEGKLPTIAQYGFLASLLHEVGHAVQRHLLQHDPTPGNPNIPLVAHEYHNILMHENFFPYRKRYQYYVDKGTTAETRLGTTEEITEKGNPQAAEEITDGEKNFRTFCAIIYRQLIFSDAITEYPTIIDDLPELKKTLQLLRTPKNPPDSSPMDSATGTAAIDKTVDSDKVAAAADETKATEKPSSALQPSAQEEAPPAPPPPGKETAPQAKEGAYAATRKANQEKKTKKAKEKEKALKLCLRGYHETIKTYVPILVDALRQYSESITQEEKSETHSQEKGKLPIQKAIDDVLTNYSTLDELHQGSFLMEFLASLFAV